MRVDMAKTTQLNKHITVDPEVRFEKPCIGGTRVAVVDILNLLGAGYTIEEIPDQYPELTQEQIKAAIQFATRLTEEPTKVLDKTVAKK